MAAATPRVRRMHLFEMSDQPWFPAFLRSRVQTGLTVAWNMRVPLLQSASPAKLVGKLLTTHLNPVSGYAFVDFCAGGGGPTPEIERAVNSARLSPPSAAGHGNGDDDNAAAAACPFVLTDLHPNVERWHRAAAASPNVSYVREPVDASAAPAILISRLRGGSAAPGASSYAAVAKQPVNGDDSEDRMGAAVAAAVRPGAQPRKIFRLFNLAFHHFDDPLARAILKDTVETSDGFGIFELQHRTWESFFTTFLFGVGIMLYTPIYALLERDFAVALFFTYMIPIIPFVLVVDGWVSGLRTRTPDEIEALLRSCGAEGGTDGWELRSGSERHLWPCGRLHWVICVKKT